MKLKINLIKHQLVLVLVLLTQVAQAQSQTQGIDFDDDVQDVPVASIDNWITPMILLAIVGVLMYYQRQQKLVKY